MFEKLSMLFVHEQRPTIEDFDKLLKLRGSSLQEEINAAMKRADDLGLEAKGVEAEAEDQQAKILAEFEEKRKAIILERDRQLKLVEGDQLMARDMRRTVRMINDVLSRFDSNSK